MTRPPLQHLGHAGIAQTGSLWKPTGQQWGLWPASSRYTSDSHQNLEWCKGAGQGTFMLCGKTFGSGRLTSRSAVSRCSSAPAGLGDNHSVARSEGSASGSGGRWRDTAEWEAGPCYCVVKRLAGPCCLAAIAVQVMPASNAAYCAISCGSLNCLARACACCNCSACWSLGTDKHVQACAARTCPWLLQRRRWA